MTPNDPIVAAKVGLSLGLLWLFWNYVWKPSALDTYRQDLFRIRDRLFLSAAERRAGLGFESKAYRALRTSMNGLIRYGHIFNIPSAVIFALVRTFPFAGDKAVATNISEVDDAINAVTDPDAKKLLRQFHLEVGRAGARYLLRTSPTFVVFFVALVIAVTAVVGCVVLVHGMKQSFRLSFLEELQRRTMSSFREVEIQASIYVEDGTAVAA